jgi:hypothetical protein
MPKVKLLTSMAGIDFSHNQGDVIDCNEAEAVRFISAGIAEPVEAVKVERAVKTQTTRKAAVVQEDE